MPNVTSLIVSERKETFQNNPCRFLLEFTFLVNINILDQQCKLCQADVKSSLQTLHFSLSRHHQSMQSVHFFDLTLNYIAPMLTSLDRNWSSRWENSILDSVLSPPQQKDQAVILRCEGFLSPKEQSNYSQSEASISSKNSLPGQYCENKARILPLLSPK